MKWPKNLWMINLLPTGDVLMCFLAFLVHSFVSLGSDWLKCDELVFKEVKCLCAYICSYMVRWPTSASCFFRSENPCSKTSTPTLASRCHKTGGRSHPKSGAGERQGTEKMRRQTRKMTDRFFRMNAKAFSTAAVPGLHVWSVKAMTTWDFSDGLLIIYF